MSNYFSKKDIAVNRIRRIETPVYSSVINKVLSRPVILIFREDGTLFCLMSYVLFRLRKKQGLPIITDAEVPNFYCELRQVL